MLSNLSKIVLVLGLLLCGSVHGAPKILVMGDSLSAAYGIEQREGWVALLQQRLMQENFPHELINLSVSGETTAGGLRRFPAALAAYEPAIVLLELGANDGLRGLSLNEMQANLEQMITASKAVGAQVLLFEMRIPPNYGQRYTESFQGRFATIAKEQNVVLLPFFLASIALDPSAFQDDGIHPTAQSQPAILDVIWPVLLPQLSAKD